MLRTSGACPRRRSSKTSSAAEVADEPAESGSESWRSAGIRRSRTTPGCSPSTHRSSGTTSTPRRSRSTHEQVRGSSAIPRRRSGVAIDRGVRRQLSDAGVGLHWLCRPRSRSTTRLPCSRRPEGECTDAGIEDYDDGVYTGRFQTFTDCADTGTVYVTVAAVPPDNSFTAVVGSPRVRRRSAKCSTKFWRASTWRSDAVGEARRGRAKSPLESPSLGASLSGLISPCGDSLRPAEPPPADGVRIGVTLSGGGFRATFAGLGRGAVPRRRRSARRSPIRLVGVRWVGRQRDDRDAVRAATRRRLQRPRRSTSSVIEPLAERVVRASLKSKLIRNIWRTIGRQNRTDVLARAFNDWLFDDVELEDLDPGLSVDLQRREPDDRGAVRVRT